MSLESDPHDIEHHLRALRHWREAMRLEALFRLVAIECLPYLRVRAERFHIPNLLLRPAGSPENYEATLLRPTLGMGQTQAEQLLRPAEERMD